MIRISGSRGFTLVELLIATTIALLLAAAALSTFRNGLMVNDSAAQMSDANQNLRAGSNRLIRDLMQAGRIIGPEGIPMPAGAGVQSFMRPGPVANLTFDLVVDATTTLNLPSLETGYQLGPTVAGAHTDIVTIMTVDEFMPVIQTPPAAPASPTPVEGTIAPNGQSVAFPSNSVWLAGDPVNGSGAIQVGDLVLFKNPIGTALVSVTGKDSTHIYFGALDWFRFNQFNVPQVPILLMKQVADTTTAWTQKTTIFRALMITYFVDNSVPGAPPRLMRQVNHFSPQALAGVVEDLDLDVRPGRRRQQSDRDHLAAVHRRRRGGDLHVEPDPESEHPPRRPLRAHLPACARLCPQPHLHVCRCPKSGERRSLCLAVADGERRSAGSR